MKKNRLYVFIGVFVGILVGFVFGLAYDFSDANLKSNGNAKGNVMELMKYRHGNAGTEAITDTNADTLKYTVTDENGENWTLTINKQ